MIKVITSSYDEHLSYFYSNYDDIANYEKLKEVYINRLSTNKTVNDLVKAFKSFDKNNTETININDLKHGLTVLGEPLSEYQFKLLLEEANCENDGTIDYIKLSEKIFGEKYSK